MYELIRKTLIIVLCLTISKLLHLSVSVYMVLFAILLANFCYSKHISDLLKILLPSVVAAIGAAIINEAFAAHPFIIWTACVLYFDHVRRRAVSNLHISGAILPLFMIIFITTYHNASGYVLLVPTFVREVLLNMLVAVLVTSAINHLMPIKVSPQKPVFISQPVNGADRLKMLVLVGGGLAFIMINEVTSAVFCLVPLITSAMQASHAKMKQHTIEKILAQIGGCSLAMLVSLLFSGTEVNVISYFIISFLLVFVLLYWSHRGVVSDRAIHGDALMGFLIPYQLYVVSSGDDFGLSSIALRAVELFIALVVIYWLAHWLDRMTVASDASEVSKSVNASSSD